MFRIRLGICILILFEFSSIYYNIKEFKFELLDELVVRHRLKIVAIEMQ